MKSELAKISKRSRYKDRSKSLKVKNFENKFACAQVLAESFGGGGKIAKFRTTIGPPESFIFASLGSPSVRAVRGNYARTLQSRFGKKLGRDGRGGQ